MDEVHDAFAPGQKDDETRQKPGLTRFRSAAIFLYERQRPTRSGKRSLPDWQRKNLRHPNLLIGQWLGSAE
jgi:hypothetical protein